jgi:LmbE family N-acetylglucosaminyl deacetylase
MQIQTSEDIKKLGNILGVWAHPDDEVFSMGAIMATAIRNDQKVVCVTATRGEAGVQDETRWPSSQLAQIRTEELEHAYEILGVTEHFWLDYPDGGCMDVNQNEAIQRVVSLIEIYKPDSILTFGPEGMTGHPDHQTVSAWASLANEKAGSNAKIYHATNTKEQYDSLKDADEQFSIFFNIEQPPITNKTECDICFCPNDKILGTKIAALKAMPSQTEGLLKIYETDCRKGFGVEAFVKPK